MIRLEDRYVEQFINICERYPVASGDLISKGDKAVLASCGLIAWRKANPSLEGVTGLTDGERLGGWVPTDEGVELYNEHGFMYGRKGKPNENKSND